MKDDQATVSGYLDVHTSTAPRAHLRPHYPPLCLAILEYLARGHVHGCQCQ